MHLCRGVSGDTPRSEAHELAWDLGGIQVADCIPPKNGLVGQFCHSLSSSLCWRFGHLIVRRVEASLREQPNVSCAPRGFRNTQATPSGPLAWDTLSLDNAGMGIVGITS